MLNRPCIDCNKITRSTRCIECKRIKERQRATPEQRGYDYEWRKLSKAFRKENPFCVICGTNIDLTTDHIVSKAKGGLSIWSNLQTLCRNHNSEKGSQ